MIWNLLMLLLWIICVTELFQQKEDFILQIFVNISNLNIIQNDHYHRNSALKGFIYTITFNF